MDAERSPHEIIGFADTAALVEHAALAIAAAARDAVSRRGRFLCALAGGGTPRPVYARLAEVEDVPWDRTTLVYGDERCVPAGDPRSNHEMVRETLLSHLPAGASPIVLPMPGHLADHGVAVRQYEAALRALGDSATPMLDLALLGIGTDGHTASLFPGSPVLAADGPHLVAVAWSAETATHRLTLTPHILRASRARLFLVSGASKAGMVARATGPDTELPAGRVGPATWLVAPAPAFPGSRPPGSSF